MAKRRYLLWAWALAGASALGSAATAFGQAPPPALPVAPVYTAPVPPQPALPAGQLPPAVVVGQAPTATPKGGSAFATLLQTPPPALATPVPTQQTSGQAPMPPAKTPSPTDPGLSSRPPAFTIPPTAKDSATPKDKASTDPAAPAVTNDANAFSGFPDVQDAFSSLLSGNFKDTKYKWYGFVRLDGIYDTKPMGSTDSFVTSSIPVPQGKGQNAVLTPRYTRLGFDTSTPVPDYEDWTIKTRIEMDFFNGNTSGAFGSFPPRLRFAWIDVGPFLVGQAASLFMDYDVFPNVLDYEGPPGMILMRQPVAAVRIPLADRLKLTVGVEQPYSDIQWEEGGVLVTNPGTGIITTAGVPKNIQNIPDFTANLRYVGDYGHVQLAGIARRLAFQSATEQTYAVTGYGVNVTASFHPWACLHGVTTDTEERTPMDKSRILGQYATGRGISRYIQDINGLGLDATFQPSTGLSAISATGWFIAYEQWWTDTLLSNFSYGQARLDLSSTMPDDTYRLADYATANLIWLPFPRFGVGLEFIYGSRENKDGAKGSNSRIQTGVQYRF